MAFGITKQSLSATLVSFMLLAALFLYRGEAAGYVPTDGAAVSGLPLAELMASNGFLAAALLFLPVFVNSFYVTRVVSRNLIFAERTYMPSVVYLMTSLGYAFSPGSVVVTVAAFLVIFAAEQMIASWNRDGRNSYFLNASLALGVAAMIYPPASVLLLWLFSGLILFGRPVREWIISIALFSFPFFVLSYISWGIGGEFSAVWKNMFSAVAAEGGDLYFGGWEYVFAAIAATMTVMSLISLRGRGREKGMRKRSYTAFKLFAWLLLFTVAMFAMPCRSAEMLPLPAVALAVVVPAWFNRNHGLVPDIVYAVTVASVIIYNITRLWQA